jgi:hypothetical protein
MVTGVAAFPGCWQLVTHLVLPESQPSSSQLQLLQQQVQQAALQVLAAYPDDCQLLSAQLQPVATNYMTAATMPAGTAAAAEGSASAPVHAGVPVLVSAAADVYMLPVALALPIHSTTRNSSSSSSSSSSKADGACSESVLVNVCIAQPVVMQLLCAGHSSVRVVVTSQLPGAAALADNTWQLPNTGAAAAAVVPRSPEADDAHGALADVCLPVQLTLSDLEKLLLLQQQ